MLCIHNKSTEPYFNMAAEEHFFKNFNQNIFMLWQNDSAIIVGKHQNTLSEINIDYVKEKGIKVVRRLSGGGAVFHDLGNLNFTFIESGTEGKLVDFKKYTQPIIDVLNSLGINAVFEGRNDLTIDGKKFSGNAEHVIRDRVLHHGTLLFSSVMSNLANALKADESKFDDKAVKSIRSRVTNINEHLKKPISISDFTDLIMKHIMESNKNSELYVISEKDKEIISELSKTKYSTWEWNYGHQAKYNFSNKKRTNGGSIELKMYVDKGIIEKVKFYGDFFNKLDIADIEKSLIGTPHKEDEIRLKLSGLEISDYFANVSFDEFISVIF